MEQGEKTPRSLGAKVVKKIGYLEDKVDEILKILRKEEEEHIEQEEGKEEGKRKEHRKKSAYHQFISSNFHKYADKGLQPREIISKLAKEYSSKHTK